MNRRLRCKGQGQALTLLLLITLTACGSKATPTPTPTAIVGAGDAAVAFFEQQMYQNLTQQAIDNDRIQQAAVMTATQQVIAATATQQAHNEAISATRRAESATQRAFEVTVQAAQAADTATAQARADSITATVQAQATATQNALFALATQESRHATATADYRTQQAPFEAARLESLRIEQEKAQMELDKAKATMWLSAYGGWVFALLVAVAAGFVIWKKSEIGVITDENGKVRVVMINKRALAPELMLNPVMDFSKDVVSVPALGIPEETQRQVKHEQTIVEAIKHLPPGYQKQGLGLAAGMMQPTPGAPSVDIQVVQPANVQPWLDDVQGQMSEKVED